MHYGLSIVTEPAQEPIGIDDCKAQLRIDTADEEGYVRGLIKASRRLYEQTRNRTLVNTVWRMTLDEFPDGDCAIKPPRPPLQSVTSVVYVNSTGGNTTMASSDYGVDTYSQPGRIYLAYGQTWPTAREIENAVTITYQAGYGGSAATVNESIAAVPQTTKHGLALLVGHWFRNREPVNIGNIVNALPYAVEALFDAEWAGDYS